jgi:glycosyltransferase involved in cell wall biosynthesis
MKIFQVGMGWFPDQPGGLNRFFYDCCQHLPKYDIEFSGLVTGSLPILVNPSSRIYAFALQDSSLLNRWLAASEAAKQLIAATQPDLIASHFALYSLPVLRHLHDDLPLVTHFHGPWALEGNAEGNRTLATWLKKQIELPTYRRADRFIVLSDAFRQILHCEYAVPLDKIEIVPGGVDLDRFTLDLLPTEARGQLGWSQDRPILLAVRRLAKRMGLENLIAAMVEIRRHHPDTLLLIAGKGKLQPQLQDQIDTLGLQDSVKLLGFLPDEQLPLAYRAANLSVVPTVALEGFGLIVIESLAAGTPVMGTPIGGIPEILTPLSPDLLFAYASPPALATGIIEALGGARSLPSPEACRAYVEAHYAWPVIAQKIKAVYEQTLASKLR